jgi:hypothetical protein
MWLQRGRKFNLQNDSQVRVQKISTGNYVLRSYRYCLSFEENVSDVLSMVFNYRPHQKKCINLLGNRIKILQVALYIA